MPLFEETMEMRQLSLTLILILFAVGCNSAQPTQAPLVLPTVGLPTFVPLPTEPPLTVAPTVTATSAPSPTLPPATVAVTRTIVAASPAPVIVPTATRVLPTPTLAVTPGLYVTNLRLAPDPPVRGEIEFFATFLNATGAGQDYRWLVYIYRADAPNRSTGETSRTQTRLQLGSAEYKSLGNWKLGPGGGCEFFFARVAFLDESNRPVMFTKPDGKVYEKPFSVC